MREIYKKKSPFASKLSFRFKSNGSKNVFKTKLKNEGKQDKNLFLERIFNLGRVN